MVSMKSELSSRSRRSERPHMKIDSNVHRSSKTAAAEQPKSPKSRTLKRSVAEAEEDIPPSVPLNKRMKKARPQRRTRQNKGSPEPRVESDISADDKPITKQKWMPADSPELKLDNIFDEAVPDPDDDIGSLCELHTYDAQTNSRGEMTIMQTGQKQKISVEKQQSHQAALVLTRFLNSPRVGPGFQPLHILHVRSPHIKAAMRDVIKAYPGVNMDTQMEVLLYDKPRCLFHYRDELHEYAMLSDDPERKKHILFALDYMRKALNGELSVLDLMLSDEGKAPGLDFNNLWMAFKPGDLLFMNFGNVEQVSKFVDMTKNADEWVVAVHDIECDGKDFGIIQSKLTIKSYDSYKPFVDLEAYPLRYHKEAERVRKELIERGKKFVSLFGVHFRLYDGVAETLNDALFNKSGKLIALRHRVVIDQERCLIETDRAVEFVPGTIIETKSKRHLHMTDEEFLICEYQVPGYSLMTKSWYNLNVSHVKDIEFDTDAFDRLVLRQEKKDLIRSLVKPKRDSKGFDDLIRGKGKGIIFLLHGPPGAGKTFTAESIAEHLQRPLYVITCGDLGQSGSSIDENLSKALSLAIKWNAIVLIDEADVFMAERRVDDVARNGLVSVFLRLLEYFEGILFLTTNRMEVIDPAFKSRIHLPIAYPPLSKTARKNIWRTFVSQAFPNGQPAWFDDFVQTAAKYDLNGREIKNIIRVAYALAEDDVRKITAEDIFFVLRSCKSFEDDFKDCAVEVGLLPKLLGRVSAAAGSIMTAMGAAFWPKRK